jgi:hypothetical protein
MELKEDVEPNATDVVKNSATIQQRLFDLAGYGNISASSSFLVTVFENNSVREKPFKDNELGSKKIFIPVYLNAKE